eukprot:TRINITY_DN12933_c0_g1_i3.p1 TRINITY_DN12933_c0_g1~~TRINITY_DN12933_c0_g1_i3.p1  ORF type:complete len:159 (-),score=51.65 TRINITY_DN12933_c0_g1_i3:45-521(-)
MGTSNKTLEANHTEIEKRLENERSEALRFEKEITNEILQLNNDIAFLQKRQEDLMNKKIDLQAGVESSNNEASSKNLTLGRILMAIDNIYQRCLEGSSIIRYDNEERRDEFEKVKEPTDEEYFAKKGELAMKKLKVIGNYMSDFNTIIQECRKEKKKG